MPGGIGFFRLRPAAMRYDCLTLPEEPVGHGHALVQETAGIVAQIEHQALDIILAETFQVLLDLRTSGLVEGLDVHVSDARFYPDGVLYALPGDLVANYVEGKRLVIALARDDDLDLGAAWSFQEIGDFRGRQVLGGLVVHRHDDVTGPDSGLVRRRPGERRNHDSAVIPFRDRHADSVIVALLVFPQELEIARIEEVRVRIERAEHARDSALVQRLIR